MENIIIDVSNPLTGYDSSIKHAKVIFEYTRSLILQGIVIAFRKENGRIDTILTSDFDEVSDLEVMTVEEFDYEIEQILRQLKYKWN